LPHIAYINEDMSCQKHTALSRREILKAAASTLVLPAMSGITAINAGAQTARAVKLDISDRLSPLNSKRPVRPQTRYIILHTTEGSEAGSLNKLVQYGEAHYFIALSGRVYRIIDRAKIAKHAGRSMWEGRSTIDNHSLGIEVSGYHNRDITAAQYEALKELLRQLKSLYNVPDERVLTHSMVAYGRPNRFHDENHRGRKRCGMLFADPKVRARLGLNAAPDRDTDVAAGRLKVADKELYAYLFSTARSGSPPAIQSAKTSAPAKPSAPKEPPAAPPVEIAAAKETAAVKETAPAPKPASEPKPAALAAKPAPEPLEMPFESQEISPGRSAWQIARERYNSSSTIYEFPDGRRLNGSQINDWGRIPTGTRVILAETEESDSFEGFLEIGKDGDSPQALAGKAYNSATTIYFFPDGLIRTGAELQKQTAYRSLFKNPPDGTRLLVGYVYGGYVRNSRRPSIIAGIKWNYPSTYYRFPDGRILSGDDVRDNAIPARTLVFFQE
jgi:N-acetyl-anhydromuramyl-L-alanine amidase AmpD